MKAIHYVCAIYISQLISQSYHHFVALNFTFYFISLTPLFFLYPISTDIPSSAPSVSNEPSSSPSESTKPSSVPSVSLQPTTTSSPSESAEPSSSPSTSAQPSQSPSVLMVPSSVPSESQVPSSLPSVSMEPSSSPSTSAQPSQSPSLSMAPSSVPSTSSVPSLEPSSNPSALTDMEFLIKSTFEKFDSSRELGWCLTAFDKDDDQKLNVRPCKPYETRADNLQLWTFGPNKEIMLAGTSVNNMLCIKSTFRQLKLETCSGDVSERNFTLGPNFISQTRNGKAFYFGFDLESRFERVRLYREGTLNEVLNKWTVVYRSDIPDSHLLFTSSPSVSLVPSLSPSDTDSVGYICHNTDSKTWDANRDIAKASPGGDLVTIHCQEQNAKVNSLVGGTVAWIGAHDKNTEGTWEWVDGTPVVYENWASDEPNDYGSGEDCAHWAFSGIQWNDRPCDYLTGGIYESATDLTNNSGISCIEYVGK